VEHTHTLAQDARDSSPSLSGRYEPSASANVLDAQLEDIVLVMEASVAAEDKAGRDGAEP